VTSLPCIAAVIGHADEFGMLECCIAHHARLGVERFFISADAAAVRGQDGLNALALRDDVRIAYRGEDAEGFRVFSAAAVQIAEWARPDWILLIDSDEFCMSAHNDLRRSAALAHADIVQLERFNVPPMRDSAGAVRNADPARLDEARFISRPRAVDLRDLSEQMAPPWIMAAIAPRVVARPNVMQAIPTGGHEVTASREDVERRIADDVCVLHLPFTTYERFERKIERVMLAVTEFGHLYAPGEAAHWRRWAAIAQRGRLPVEFDRQFFDEETVRALVRDDVMTTVVGFFTPR
jgi:hypothetical protein